MAAAFFLHFPFLQTSSTSRPRGKACFSTVADLGSNSAFLAGLFWIFYVESCKWLENWYSSATLQDARRYRTSAKTSWPGVSILWVVSLICSVYLSVAARTIVWSHPSLRYTRNCLGSKATNQQLQSTLAQFAFRSSWYAYTIFSSSQTVSPGS